MGLLDEGDPLDRSRGEWAVLWSMYQHDWTLHDALVELGHPWRGAGAKFRQEMAKNPVRAQQRMVRQWNKIVRLVADNPPSARRDPQEVASKVASIEAFADAHASHLFKGQRTLDRVALGVLCGIALKACNLQFGVSTRRLAVEVSCRQETAGRVLNRLMDGPFLTLVEGASGVNAARYRLVEPDRLVCPRCGDETGSVVRTPAGETTTDPILYTRTKSVHDVFSSVRAGRRTLGRTASLVLDTLLTQAASDGDLARHLGKDKRTIRRALDRLHSAGLVTTTGSQWSATQVSLDDLADALGVPPVRQARQDTFATQREAYRQRLDNIASATGASTARWHRVQALWLRARAEADRRSRSPRESRLLHAHELRRQGIVMEVTVWFIDRQGRRCVLVAPDPA